MIPTQQRGVNDLWVVKVVDENPQGHGEDVHGITGSYVFAHCEKLHTISNGWMHWRVGWDYWLKRRRLCDLFILKNYIYICIYVYKYIYIWRWDSLECSTCTSYCVSCIYEWFFRFYKSQSHTLPSPGCPGLILSSGLCSPEYSRPERRCHHLFIFLTQILD